MRVLVVLAQPPGLEAGAPARGAVAQLRGLALHGIDVRALAARRPAVAATETPSDLRVEVVDVDQTGHGELRRQLKRARYPRGSLVGPFSDHVRELAADVDVIHLDETETAWCNIGSSKPASLQMHFRTLRDRRPSAPWKHEFRFVSEYAVAELVAARRYRSLIANSQQVAASLRRLNRRADIVFAPFSLEPSHYPQASLDGPPLAGLIGTYSWPPTADAMARLTTRIWPRVHRSTPDAQLLIAGRGTEALRATRTPATLYVGEVSSTPDFLAQLWLLLYPAPRGSGVKVKVLEAMACGVPVVTTAPGAEGICNNEGVVVCETDDELVATAVRLLNDVDECRGRGSAARETFLRDHTPARATEPLVALFQRMA